MLLLFDAREDDSEQSSIVARKLDPSMARKPGINLILLPALYTTSPGAAIFCEDVMVLETS